MQGAQRAPRAQEHLVQYANPRVQSGTVEYGRVQHSMVRYIIVLRYGYAARPVGGGADCVCDTGGWAAPLPLVPCLGELLPGLGKHLTASRVFTPETFRDRYLSPHGAGFSIEPRILQSAWFRPHNVSEEAKGLYLVGAGTHPGAGLPGVISSAEVLAQLVPEPVGVEVAG